MDYIINSNDLQYTFFNETQKNFIQFYSLTKSFYYNQQLAYMYRHDLYMKKIASMKAEDSLAPWRTVHIPERQNEINTIEKNFFIKKIMVEALKKALVFGGVFLYYDFSDCWGTPVEEPVDWDLPKEMLKLNSIKIITQQEIWKKDLIKDDSGNIKYILREGQKYHISRFGLIYGDDNVLEDSIYKKQEYTERTPLGISDFHNVLVLLQIMSSLPNSMQNIMMNQNKLIYRTELINLLNEVETNGTTNMLNQEKMELNFVLSKVFEYLSKSFGMSIGTSESMDTLKLDTQPIQILKEMLEDMLIKATNLTMTRFNGSAVAGAMGSESSKDDMRRYNQAIQVYQTRIAPAIEPFDRFICQQLGLDYKIYTYDFNSLDYIDRESIRENARIDYDMGIITLEECRRIYQENGFLVEQDNTNILETNPPMPAQNPISNPTGD